MDLETAKAWRIKEMLRWVRRAKSKPATKWRLTKFVNEVRSLAAGIDLLKDGPKDDRKRLGSNWLPSLVG